ncbi:hypothetical protein FOA52_012531 [Chlamydomonas sp. UWO 241]|nr:hypothetical protein FOA52_012531 [Chlamydomonas sp. UWO 241]
MSASMKLLVLALCALPFQAAASGYSPCDACPHPRPRTLPSPCLNMRNRDECEGYPTGECYWRYLDCNAQGCTTRTTADQLCMDRDDECSGRCCAKAYSSCVEDYSAICFWDAQSGVCKRKAVLGGD